MTVIQFLRKVIKEIYVTKNRNGLVQPLHVSVSFRPSLKNSLVLINCFSRCCWHEFNNKDEFTPHQNDGSLKYLHLKSKEFSFFLSVHTPPKLFASLHFHLVAIAIGALQMTNLFWLCSSCSES